MFSIQSNTPRPRNNYCLDLDRIITQIEGDSFYLEQMTRQHLAPEPTTADVVPNYVARYWDMVALADKTPAKVIGENGMLRDKPGFEVDFITRDSASDEMHTHDMPSVLMPVRGHWRVTWEGGEDTLAPGDTMSVPAGMPHAAVPSMTGEAALYHVIGTGDPAGLTWTP